MSNREYVSLREEITLARAVYELYNAYYVEGPCWGVVGSWVIILDDPANPARAVQVILSNAQPVRCDVLRESLGHLSDRQRAKYRRASRVAKMIDDTLNNPKYAPLELSPDEVLTVYRLSGLDLDHFKRSKWKRLKEWRECHPKHRQL